MAKIIGTDPIDTKKNLKQLHRLLDIDDELQKCLIIVHRFKLSLNRFVYLIENIPETIKGHIVDRKWNKKFRIAEATQAVDTHALMIHSYHLLKLIQNNKYLKGDISNDTKELIEIMRHHYEHWDKMKRYYHNDKVVQPIPPSGSVVEKYFKKYRTSAKESPVGSLSMGVFSGRKFVRNITIGGSMNLSDMARIFNKLKKKTTTLIKECRKKI